MVRKWMIVQKGYFESTVREWCEDVSENNGIPIKEEKQIFWEEAGYFQFEMAQIEIGYLKQYKETPLIWFQEKLSRISGSKNLTKFTEYFLNISKRGIIDSKTSF